MIKPFSWIKLSTDFFDDPKVLRLQTYPEKDFLLIFWIRIVLLSLRRNDGLLLIDDTIPYSVSDFVAMFRKDENVIRMALAIFEKLNMIAVKPSDMGEIIGIREFTGFTDVEGLEDMRKKNREKQAAFRARQKEALKALESGSKNEETTDSCEDVTGYGEVTNQNLEVSHEKVTGQNKNKKEKENKSKTPPLTPPQGAESDTAFRKAVQGDGSQSRQENAPDMGDGSQSRQQNAPDMGDGSQSRQKESRPCRDTKQSDEDIVLPSWLNPKDWNDFLSFRESIRSPMTSIAQSRAIGELSRLRDLGHPPEDVISQSIVNGWKGLFPISRRSENDRGNESRSRKTFDEIRRENNQKAVNAFLRKLGENPLFEEGEQKHVVDAQ